MSAFAAAINAIFADANMAVEAEWRPQGDLPPVAVRAIVRRPDGMAEFGSARLVQPALTVDIRVSDAPAPAKGDGIAFGAELHVIQAAPIRDREGLVWTLDLRPA